MWIHTKHGFMSVISYDPKKDKSRQAALKKGETVFPHVDGPTTHVLVRARVEADLFDIKKVVKSLVIADESPADYRYRAVITREQFKKYMELQIDEIDYGSHFKEVAQDTINKEQGKGAGDKRHSALMSIWSILAGLQPWRNDWTSSAYYGGGATSYSLGSKYAAKGKFGKTYAEALGGSLADLDDEIDRALSAGPSPAEMADMTDAEFAELVLGYDAAKRALSKGGVAFDSINGVIDPQGLCEILDDRDWLLGFDDPNEMAKLDDDAWEIFEILQERHGWGNQISQVTFTAVWEEVIPIADKSTGEIHSLPQDVPVE